jgi:hypothetical protein
VLPLPLPEKEYFMAELAKGFCDVVFHRLDRYFQLLRYFLIGTSMKSFEDHYPLADRG